MKNLDDIYYEWLLDYICHGIYYQKRYDYSRLLYFLYETPFTYSMEMDKNREADGIELRKGFMRRFGVPPRSSVLHRPYCSVLEMMVALACRMETHFLYDMDEGNRTGKWFWEMVDALGLSFSDRSWTDYRAAHRIKTFLDRTYFPNGRGGLFLIKEDSGPDMRELDIWYQMQAYLPSKLRKENADEENCYI